MKLETPNIEADFYSEISFLYKHQETLDALVLNGPKKQVDKGFLEICALEDEGVDVAYIITQSAIKRVIKVMEKMGYAFRKSSALFSDSPQEC